MERVALTTFVLGLLSSASPCVLPLYPGFLAYVSGRAALAAPVQRYLLGCGVLAGVLTMMLALGVAFAVLAVPIGRSLAYIVPATDVIIFGLGLLLLLDRNPFVALPRLRSPLFRQPLANAYTYGLLYGPLALPCSGPLVVSIFAVSLSMHEAFDRFWVFIWFGLGFGAPLLVLSFLSGALQHRLTSAFARHSRALNVVAGLLLVGIAVYDVLQNWEMLRLFYLR